MQPAQLRARPLPARPQWYQQPAPPPVQEKSQDLGEMFRTIWRHRNTVFVTTGAFAIGGLLLALLLPPSYTADAHLEVGVRQPQIFGSEQPTYQPSGPDAAKVESERIAAQSRNIASYVIAKLNLAGDPEFNADASAYQSGKKTFAKAPQEERDYIVDRVLDHIDVSILGRSDVLDVEARARTASMAAALANSWVDGFLQLQRDDKLSDNNRVEAYLSGRIADVRDQLAKADQAVADYRRQNGLYKGVNSDMDAQQLTDLNTQLVEAQAAKADADGKLASAEGNPDSVPEVVASPLVQALKQQEAEGARNLAQMANQYGPRHPDYIAAQAQVNDIKHKIAAETANVIGGIRSAARDADARYGAIEGDLGAAKSQMGGANEKNIRLEALEQDANVNRNLLDALLNRAKESIGREAIEEPDAKLISSASPPEKQSFPPRSLIVLLSTFGGLLIGCVLAFLRDGSDRTFRRSDQIEQATGVPVIAMVPTLKDDVPSIVHVLRKPISPYSDALRKIYIGLQLTEQRHAPKTVLSTSATPAEGKSTTTASLARLLAQNGKRVLLIDCDWRSPTLNHLFRCPNRVGLAALLNEEDVRLSDAIYTDALSGLDVLVAGEWNPSTMHVLTSERMRFLIHNFAKNYDLVLLDGAPVLVGSEVLALSQMVDKNLFFVRWGHTRRDAVMEAMRQMVDAHADLAGVVLSRVDAKGYREFGYGQIPYGYSRRNVVAA